MHHLLEMGICIGTVGFHPFDECVAHNFQVVPVARVLDEFAIGGGQRPYPFPDEQQLAIALKEELLIAACLSVLRRGVR